MFELQGFDPKVHGKVGAAGRQPLQVRMSAGPMSVVMGQVTISIHKLPMISIYSHILGMFMQKFQVFWREKGQEFGRTNEIIGMLSCDIVEGLAKSQELEGSLDHWSYVSVYLCVIAHLGGWFQWMMVDGFGWIIMTSLLHHWNTGMMISKGNHL